MIKNFCVPLTAILLSSFWTAASHAQATDFENRCAAPGVVKCVGFDNETTDIVRGQNLHADGDGTYRAFLDPAVKTSGNGSLRFDLPPPPHAGANIAGRWSPTDNRGLGRMFGQNSTFYVQFRMRLSDGMLNNTWDSKWKTALFHQNQTTCGGIEITTRRYNTAGLLTMYTTCGAVHMYATLDGSQHTEVPPLLLHQGDYDCEYSTETDQTCFYFKANEWITYYYKISIGTWDQRDSMVEMWIAREGAGSYEQVIRVPQMPLTCNTNSCSGAEADGQGYNNLTLTPYMTGLSRNSGLAGIVSSMWFDELIVSTQPIVIPDAGPRPEPPTAFITQ
jgi:hypothetical protein